MATTVGNLVVKLSARTQALTKGLAKSQAALNQTAESMRRVSRVAAIMSGALAATGAASALMAGRFEKQMTRAAAIAAGSKDKFDKSFTSMSKSALQLAGATEFTAKQVGEGMEFMALAGNDANKIIGAMPAVLQLASSASLDLGRSADIVTNVMAGFGKQTSELADANNVLIGTFTSSNVSLTELGEAFKTAGPVAKSLGVAFEDTAAAIGLLGNAGIKGSEAGTGLKRAMTALVNVTPKSAKAIKQLGLDTSALTDPKRGIGSVVAQLEGVRRSMSAAGKTAEFTALLFKVFGDRAGPKMSALIEQGADSFDKLKKKIDDAKATNLAEFMETKQVETFRGQLNILVSALEKLAITVGQKVIPILKPLVQDLTATISNLANMSSETMESIVQWGKWITIGGGAVAVVAGLTAALLPLIAGLGAASLAASAMGVSLGIVAFGPLAAIVAGLAAFAVALPIVEAATGQNIDVLSVLGSELAFATQGTSELTTTMKNLGLSLVAALADLTGLTLIFPKLKSFLGELTGEVSDLDSELQKLDDTQNQLVESSKKLKNLGKFVLAAKELGAKQTGRVLGTTKSGKDFRAFQVSFGSAEEIAAVKAINDEIEEAFEAREEALENLRARKKAAADEEKRTAEEQAAEEKKLAKERARREKERLAAINRALAAQGKSKKQLRAEAAAVKKIADLRKEALRDVGEAQAVGTGLGPQAEAVSQAFGFVADFKDRMRELSEAAKKAGGNFSDPAFLGSTDLLREQLLAQAQEFVRSKAGAKDFADVVGSAVAVLDEAVPGLGARLQEFADKVEAAAGVEVDLSKSPTLGALEDVTAGFVEAEAEIAKMAENLRGAEFEKLKRVTEGELAARVKGIDNAAELAAAMGILGEVVDALGLNMENVSERIGRISPTDTVSSLAESKIATAAGGLFADGTAEEQAAVGGVVASSVMGATSGDFSAITGALGAGLGAAFGAPGVGAEIGSMVGNLLESLPSFGDAIEPVMQAFNGLLVVLDPLIAALQPVFTGVAILLGVLGKVLAPVVEILGGLLGTVMSIIIPMFQSMAASLLMFMPILKLVSTLFQLIVKPIMDLLNLFNPFVWIMMAMVPIFELFAIVIAHLNNLVVGGLLLAFDALIDPITWIAGLFRWLALAVEGMGLAVEKFLIDLATLFQGNERSREIERRQEQIATQMGRGLEELGEDQIPGLRDSLEGMLVDMDDLTSSFGDIIDFESPVIDVGEDLEEATDKLKEKLTNVPQGFKDALERFDAIDGGTTAGTADNPLRAVQPGIALEAQPVGGGGPLIGVVENMSLEASNVTELAEQLEREVTKKKRRKGGSTTTRRRR